MSQHHLTAILKAHVTILDTKKYITSMNATIPQDKFSEEHIAILDESFETYYGIYLDKDTFLLTTPNRISAVEANKSIGKCGATIAAQVEHDIFYLQVLERYFDREEIGRQDWGEIWPRVKTTYDRICKNIRNIDDWEQDNFIGDSLAILVHTAYHLGEIRHVLADCMISERLSVS